MIIKILGFVILYFLLSVPTSGASNLDLTHYKFSAKIGGPLKSNTLYQINLSREVIQRCTSDCSDLRLVDEDNSEIPYVLLKHEYAEKEKFYRGKILEYESGRQTESILFQLSEKSGPINRLEIVTPLRDFQKHIELYGSRDKKKWILLATAQIYDFSSKIALRKTELSFKEAHFPYYRIQLSGGKASQKKDVDIKLSYDGLDFSLNAQKDKQMKIEKIIAKFAIEEKSRIHDSAVFENLTKRINKAGDTEIIAEVSLPFDRLIFDVENPYFYRTVEVYYSEKDSPDSYKLLLQSPIYRFQISDHNEQKNIIEFSSQKHRYYLFKIKNNNNPSLEIKSIRFEWVRSNFFFIALKDASSYSLLVGNPSLERQEYDLSKFINRENWFYHSYKTIGMGAVTENPRFKAVTPKQKREQIEKLVLSAVVILLVVLIGFWLFSILRKAHNKISL